MRLWGVLVLVLWAGHASAQCRQALALGLDVSGSVDAREYRLQVEGLANALEHPEVMAALLSMPDAPVRLMVFEWSGPIAQRVLLDWIEIRSKTGIVDAAARLRQAERWLIDKSTAVGSAKAFGARALERHTDCWRRVLDVSGDGMSNTGPRPQTVRPAGITINGLVIGLDMAAGREDDGIAELSAYYDAYVIQGPDAFVETATGFADFEHAMVRKLLRELSVLTLSKR